MIKAAGILYLTDDRQALFLKRGNGSDHPGEWCFPGGQLEEGEGAEEAARREATEEAGPVPAGKITVLTRTIAPAESPSSAAPAGVAVAAIPGDAPPAAVTAPSYDVDYTTFLQRVRRQFDVVTCDESTGFAWASVDTPPEPLHPGARIALGRLTWDELGVARAMAAGQLTSPQVYENVTLFKIRITGTGVAYRQSLDEYVWRDPSVYLNDEFLARCNGLQVLFEHPDKATLTSREFARRSIGSVLLPFIEGNEVWAIAKVYDDAAIRQMTDEPMSTSPSVVFRDPSSLTKMEMEDGKALLIEGKPSLLDHIAICPAGVWDKGGEPRGVVVNDTHSGESKVTEEERKAAEAAALADAQVRVDSQASELTGVLSRILQPFVDGVTARMDSMQKVVDGLGTRRADADKDPKDCVADSEAETEAKRGDAEEPEDKDKPKRVVADKKADADGDEKDEEKADASEDEEDKKADEDEDKDEKKMADSAEIRRLIKDVERRLPKQLTDSDRHELADAQARADRIFQAFGDSAPYPMNAEDLAGYSRRVTRLLQRHSKALAGVNLDAVQDIVAFRALQDQIYNDAMSVATSPADVPLGRLREHVARDATGRQITSFSGEPISWMAPMMGQRQRVVQINKG